MNHQIIFNDCDYDMIKVCVSYLRELFELEGLLIKLIDCSNCIKITIDIDSNFYAKNSSEIDYAIKAFSAGYKYAENRFDRPCQLSHLIDY